MVTEVSSIPNAILEIVFAVDGAINNKSTGSLTRPQYFTCSVSPVNLTIGFFPVANHKELFQWQQYFQSQPAQFFFFLKDYF